MMALMSSAARKASCHSSMVTAAFKYSKRMPYMAFSDAGLEATDEMEIMLALLSPCSRSWPK